MAKANSMLVMVILPVKTSARHVRSWEAAQDMYATETLRKGLCI